MKNSSSLSSAKFFAPVASTILLFVFYTGDCQPPSDNSENNYVRENVMLVPGKKAIDDLEGLPVDQKKVSTNYFDGLGRATQKVSRQASPSMKDGVQPIVYDPDGVERIKYLPYISQESNGQYKPNATGKAGTYNTSVHHAFYTGSNDKVDNDEQPYAETVFEASPLNLVVKQGAVGTAWQPTTEPSANAGDDKTVKKRYAINYASDVVRFRYDEANAALSLHTDKYYPAGRLTVEITMDEHGRESRTYTDMDGRIILKKVEFDAAGGVPLYACTYYVYTDLGELAIVLPPEATTRVIEVLNVPQP